MSVNGARFGDCLLGEFGCPMGWLVVLLDPASRLRVWVEGGVCRILSADAAVDVLRRPRERVALPTLARDEVPSQYPLYVMWVAADRCQVLSGLVPGRGLVVRWDLSSPVYSRGSDTCVRPGPPFQKEGEALPA